MFLHLSNKDYAYDIELILKDFKVTFNIYSERNVHNTF